MQSTLLFILSNIVSGSLISILRNFVAESNSGYNKVQSSYGGLAKQIIPDGKSGQSENHDNVNDYFDSSDIPYNNENNYSQSNGAGNFDYNEPEEVLESSKSYENEGTVEDQAIYENSGSNGKFQGFKGQGNVGKPQIKESYEQYQGKGNVGSPIGNYEQFEGQVNIGRPQEQISFKQPEGQGNVGNPQKHGSYENEDITGGHHNGAGSSKHKGHKSSKKNIIHKKHGGHKKRSGHKKHEGNKKHGSHKKQGVYKKHKSYKKHGGHKKQGDYQDDTRYGCIEGHMKCGSDSTSFYTCVNSQYISRECGNNTRCQDHNGGIACGH